MGGERQRALLAKARAALEDLFGTARTAALLAVERAHEELWSDLRTLRLRAGADEFGGWLELERLAALERGEPLVRVLRDMVAQHGSIRRADSRVSEV
jgi:hypothetical protein